MNIPLKMNRDFEKAMTTLNERYGEDFEYLNGFHETQLNFSDFIDGFIDKNVADVTIDANANASNKDIRSLLNEKGKSHDKLFAFNKIFYEMKKRYNLKTAREWLETEYNGGFYLHDGSVGQRGGHGHDGRHRISAGGCQLHCLRLHFQNKGHLIGRHCCGAADTTPPCFT